MYVGWDLSSQTSFVKDQMSVTQKLKCYNLKIHYSTYRIRYKALFYSKWYSHSNELNTMTFHHPGHVVEVLTSKLRQIFISVSIKTLCLEPNNKSYLHLFARFPSGIY